MILRQEIDLRRQYNHNLISNINIYCTLKNAKKSYKTGTFENSAAI